MRRFIIHVIGNPLLHSCKLLVLQCIYKLFKFNIRQTSENTAVNLTTDCIALALVKCTTPVREELEDQLGKNLFIILYALILKYKPETVEKRSCKISLLSSWDAEVNDGAPRMEGINDFVFEVAGENKPTVTAKRLNVCP